MTEVAFQRFPAVVKIVIAKSDKIIACQTHRLGGHLRSLHRVPAEPVGKGASLKGIAAIQNQGVAVIGEGGSTS